MDTVLLSEATDVKEVLPVDAPLPQARYSFSQRVRSLYHALWYRLCDGLKWSRGLYREAPVEYLTQFSGKRLARIVVLQRRFDVRFEQHYAAMTAIKSYDYLDILDQAWTFLGKPRPVGGVMHDVGASNFWYARALHAFFCSGIVNRCGGRGVSYLLERLQSMGLCARLCGGFAEDFVQGV